MPETQTPRVGKVSNAATVTWSDGTNFNGFMLVGLSGPTLSGQPFPSVRYGNNGEPTEKVSTFVKIPIKNGEFNQTVGVFFNEDLSPPNTRYYAWIYTNTEFQVAGPSSSFAVTQDGWTPPSFSLGTPAAGNAPIPDQTDDNIIIPPQLPTTLLGNVDGAGYDITNLDVLGAVSGSFSGDINCDDIACDDIIASGDITVAGIFTADVVNVNTFEISGTGDRTIVVESTDAEGAGFRSRNGTQAWTAGLAQAQGPGVTRWTLHDDTFSHEPISVAASTQAVTFAGDITAPTATIGTLGVQTITQGAWFAPSLQNGWVDYTADWNVVQYTIDQMKYVHIRGACSGGTTTGGTVVFNLLPTFRPAKIEMFSIAGSGSVYIQPNGDVVIGGGIASLLPFGNIMFRTT